MSVLENRLEEELGGLLATAGLGGSQAGAVSLRLGFDGGGGATLQAAADAYGYSRERVRQLEARLRLRATTVGKPLPALHGALDVVEAAAPDERGHVGELIAAAGLARAPFDPAGVIAAAALAGRSSQAAVSKRFVTLAGETAPDLVLLRAAREQAAVAGEISVTMLADHHGYDVERVRRLLAGRREVRWVGDARSRIRVPVPGLDRRVELVLRKLLSIVPRIALSEVSDALRCSYTIALPGNVLRDLCASFTWTDLDEPSASVRALERIEQRSVLTPIEHAIARIFSARGPILSFRQVVKLGREEGLNASTVGVYLTRTPIVERVERGRYTLRGAVLGQA